MNETKNRVGRPSSGMPAKMVMKRATQARRDRLIEQGKHDFKTYVEADTKDGLQKLKTAMEVKTTGDVVDLLVKQEMKRRKIT